MEGALDFDRPAFHKSYAIAGRLLVVESRVEPLSILIDQLFAGWLLTPVRQIGQPVDLKITFYCDVPAPRIPNNLSHFEIGHAGRCYTNGEGFYVDLCNCRLRISKAESVSVDIWLEQLPLEPDIDLARAASFAVCAGLRRSGMFELHSAGVVDPVQGVGALFIGPSGSGKSTLTMQLAAAGWKYLSDDQLLLSLDHGKVVARGFRSFFAVAETSARTRGRSKASFEPATLFPSAYIEDIVPRALFFTSLANASETRVTGLSQIETMMRLLSACPWATYDKATAAENLQMLSQLARQTLAFDLAAGRDLLHPRRASSILRSHVLG